MYYFFDLIAQIRPIVPMCRIVSPLLADPGDRLRAYQYLRPNSLNTPPTLFNVLFGGGLVPVLQAG